ncbi:hypothetical protein BRE01_56040 [Brevibacillus reuszeri]|uniref:Uncharacterized protein n=1 Tax=Brevibacillus reuszeri TaxID=54915 RepID=A0A0K9Z1K0_9BACL|nr:hypothetical protein [Brevibacillus reuszeri]KNB74762.1 hypothetical protein ADS79_00070 [Brevibacillus reuszeri]MED1859598.1 hypothetical protein [Brevibacillus reuszeri]GED71902.1 hypothetical protein BRE01_56040 [Brevibacillus reuszeri]
MLLKDTNQLDDLKDFLISWYGNYDSSYGVPVDEIPAYLPKALQELYAFAGRWKDGSDDHLGNSPEIFQQQDCLYSVERLKKDQDKITFLEENQANWTCQVEAGNDDSPVYCDEHLLWDDHPEGHISVNDSLYHFLKSFCLQEVVFGCKHLFFIEGTLENIQMLFDKPIETVWLNGFYVSPKEDGPSHAFYRCGDVLVMERFGDYWLGSSYDLDLASALNDDVLSSINLRRIKPD